MSVPVVDTESSVLSFPQWEAWEHFFSASGSPYRFDLASGAFPTGMAFQPLVSVTGANSGDIFTVSSPNPFSNGDAIALGVLTGGTGLATTTKYFVINRTDTTFQVSLTLGGSAQTFSADATAPTKFFKIGWVTGAPTVPGITKVRITATNGDGVSAEVLFTIGTEAGAPSIDSNVDIIQDLLTGDISINGSSVVTPSTGAATETPILIVKEDDDLILRLRYKKGNSFVMLDIQNDNCSLKLSVKEFEPEAQVVVSDDYSQIGTGASATYLIHTKFNGSALASSLSNYVTDGDTAFDGLCEIEIIYVNPTAVGPDRLTKTSRTFRLRVERDLIPNAA